VFDDRHGLAAPADATSRSGGAGALFEDSVAEDSALGNLWGGDWRERLGKRTLALICCVAEGHRRFLDSMKFMRGIVEPCSRPDVDLITAFRQREHRAAAEPGWSKSTSATVMDVGLSFVRAVLRDWERSLPGWPITVEAQTRE